MPNFSRLNHWLTLLQHSEDEAAILDAWHDISPHLVEEMLPLLDTSDADPLEAFWRTFQQPEIGLFFEYLCSETGPLHCSNKADRVESDVLRSTLQHRLVGTAIAAALCSSDRSRLQTWLPRCGFTLAFPTPLFGATPEQSAAALFHGGAESVNERMEMADWVFCLLRARRRQRSEDLEAEMRPSAAARRCPVLIHKGGQAGAVGWLTLEREDGQEGAVYPQTEMMPLAPLSHAFREAIVTAQTQARVNVPVSPPAAFPPDVRWCLQSGADSWGGRLLLEGGSHGAAFTVALIQLCETNRWIQKRR